jgi:hypothetical protein
MVKETYWRSTIIEINEGWIESSGKIKPFIKALIRYYIIHAWINELKVKTSFIKGRGKEIW